MNSSVVFIIPPAEPLPRVLIPIVQSLLAAGFPSPADDFAVKRHDLNELLITHPAATFMWRVSGLSMIEAGIFDGDVLVVNRALTPAHKDIVVAQVDGDRSKLMDAMDAVNDRYGRGALTLASAGTAREARSWVMKQDLKTPDYTTRWTDLPCARA